MALLLNATTDSSWLNASPTYTMVYLLVLQLLIGSISWLGRLMSEIWSSLSMARRGSPALLGVSYMRVRE